MANSGLKMVCDEAMQKPGVIGVACVDPQGLCLLTQGEIPDAVAGCIAELAAQAQLLCGGDDGAVVTVETPERKVLLSRSAGVTTALFMLPASKAS